MRTSVASRLLFSVVVLSACGDGPVEPVPIALGTFELVRVDGAVLPAPLPAWLDLAPGYCAPDEETRHWLDFGRLELREFASFSLELGHEESCLSEGNPVRTRSLGSLVQGHHAAAGDSVHLSVPVGGPQVFELEPFLVGRLKPHVLELAGRGRAEGTTFVLERLDR